MVIAGSNITSIRAVDAANNRSTAEDESSFQAGSPFPWVVFSSIKLVAFLFQFKCKRGNSIENLLASDKTVTKRRSCYVQFYLTR